MIQKMSQVAVYDFTISAVKEEALAVMCELNKIAKKWVFQFERSERGYEHFQGRLSLIKKKRINELIKLCDSEETPLLNKAHFSITSSNGVDTGDFYCMKLDTRVAGPWKNTDQSVKDAVDPPYIPRQVREITHLYPWQQSVRNQLDV